MREVRVSRIRDVVAELCIKANTILRPDIHHAIKKASKKERNKKAKHILEVLLENAAIAKKEKRALCQDTGIACVLVEVGQDVRLTGGNLKAAINSGVKDGYKKAFLRKSVVRGPLTRENTGTNTPAVIYIDIVKRNRVKLTVVPKGFGSENKSRLVMLNPTAGEKEIISFVNGVVKDAGADACPPYVLGVGLGVGPDGVGVGPVQSSSVVQDSLPWGPFSTH